MLQHITFVHITAVMLAGWALALFGGALRLAPYTKPFWGKMPAWLQAWLPSFTAGLPTAISAFQSVKTWMDAAQAALVTAAVFGAFAVPGASSPHNHPDQMAAYAAKKTAAKAPSIPPLFPGMLMVFVGMVYAMVCFSCSALPLAKAADQAAVLLCADYFGKANPTLSLQDVEKDFCSAAEDIAPFLAEAKAAEQKAGVELQAKKAKPQ